MKKSDVLIYTLAILSSILMIFVLSTTKSISYNIENNDNFNVTNITNLKQGTKKVKNYELDYELDNLILRILMDSNNDTKIAKKEKSEKIAEKSSITDFKVHIVKKGDCLWLIAKRNRVSLPKLIEINNIENPDLIKPGAKIKILSSDKLVQKKKITSREVSSFSTGYYHKVLQGENLYEIAKTYRVDIKELIIINGIKRPNRILIGSKLKIPLESTVAKRRYLKNYKPKGFIWPILGKLTSGFGMRKNPITRKLEFHKGVDIAMRVGSNIIASANGVVIHSSVKGGYGNTVILKHKGGYITVYAHNHINLVKVGQYIRRGQVVAKVGMTGLTTGPHVHFEIRKYAKAIDPMLLISRKYLR